jgi:HAD superfamily hydrolase (TIGR01509 family)
MTEFPCPPAAIIFDMDGLLVDSERLWKKAETAMLADRGKIYNDEKHAPFIGMAVDEFLGGIRRAYDLTDDIPSLRAELEERVIDIITVETLPQPGANELVEFVLSKGIKHGVASSSPMDVINSTIGSQKQWDDAFPIRCSADQVTLGKPAPDVYLFAAESLGFTPSQCLALEDSPNGTRSAVAAGMTCFSVPDLTHSKPEAFVGITPYVFHSLHDVLAKLKECY